MLKVKVNIKMVAIVYDAYYFIAIEMHANI